MPLALRGTATSELVAEVIDHYGVSHTAAQRVVDHAVDFIRIYPEGLGTIRTHLPNGFLTPGAVEAVRLVVDRQYGGRTYSDGPDARAYMSALHDKAGWTLSVSRTGGDEPTTTVQLPTYPEAEFAARALLSLTTRQPATPENAATILERIEPALARLITQACALRDIDPGAAITEALWAWADLEATDAGQAPALIGELAHEIMRDYGLTLPIAVACLWDALGTVSRRSGQAVRSLCAGTRLTADAANAAMHIVDLALARRRPPYRLGENNTYSRIQAIAGTAHKWRIEVGRFDREDARSPIIYADQVVATKRAAVALANERLRLYGTHRSSDSSSSNSSSNDGASA